MKRIEKYDFKNKFQNRIKLKDGFIWDKDNYQLIKDNEKPLINGEQFRHRNITDLTKSAFIEFLKKQESSFYKDGAKVDDIKEQYVSLESENKREILYRNVEVAFTLNQSLNNEYIILYRGSMIPDGSC